MLKGFWRLRDAQLVSIKSLMPTQFKNTLLLLHANSRWVHNTTRELRQKQPNWEHKTWIVTKFHHKPAGQRYFSENYLRKTSVFLLYVSYHLLKRLRRYQVMKPPEQKAQILGVLIPWQDSWEWGFSCSVKFSVFTPDTYRPGICLARSSRC